MTEPAAWIQFVINALLIFQIWKLNKRIGAIAELSAQHVEDGQAHHYHSKRVGG